MANRKEKASPRITISIGTFDRPRIVEKLLKQLLQVSYSINIEVIVVDQSDENNFRFLQSKFPKKDNFKLLRLKDPNLCISFNLGWQNATAPIVLYLDDDVTITETTIRTHLDAYKNSRIMGVAGRVINDNEPITKEKEVGKVKFFGAIFLKNFSSESAGFADFPYGCHMSFRKDALQKTGGFDEKLEPPIFAYNEIDLGYRINKKWPKSILFLPDALVYHRRYPRGGTRTFNQKVLKENLSLNYGYFIAKNFNLFENILFLLRRIPYQLLKEPGEIPSIIKGYLKGKISNFKPFSVLVLSIFMLISFLHYWKIYEYFFFGIDEEYQSLLALSIIKDFHPIWIGLSAGETGFYVGPGLVYLHALLLWLTKLDPISLAYTASTIGLITSIALYYITRKLFSQKIALISTIFYSFSPFILYYNRRFWNPTLVPLTSLLLFYSLLKSEKDSRWYIFTTILLGLSFHIHASLLFYVPLTFVILTYRLIKDGFKINLKITFISITIFTLIYSPLLVYDFVHNFDNLKTPLRILQSNNNIKFIDYYLLVFFPFLAIAIGTILRRLNYKLLGLITFLYILFSLQNFFSWRADSGLAVKKRLIKETVAYIGVNTFRLETDQQYIYFGGWRYLFEAFGKKPESSHADEMFGWIYQREISGQKPDLKVVISTQDVDFQQRVLKKIASGIYRAYVISNTD